MFELTSKDAIYQVRYVYNVKDLNQTTLEYIEWVNQGELLSPASQEMLVFVKNYLENN